MPIHNQTIWEGNKAPSPAGLRVLGAYFSIEVHVPTQIANVLKKQGTAVPKPVSGVALIDTGATMTCIDESILAKTLLLNPIGRVTSGTANGPVQQNVYPGRIVFTQHNWIMDVGRVAGVDLTGQVVREQPPKPIIALLGRDFLERGIFIYNGTLGHWSLSM